MITIRKAEDRGHADEGWLKTSHTFSFADYHDRHFMHFESLRVINDDYIAPSQGFPQHSHNNMEIITYVLSGSLEHKDSMGNHSVILPGEVQRMSAGTGVTHSEYNHSSTETLHLLQIWFFPNQEDVKPSYEQKMFPDELKRGKFCLVASEKGENGSVSLHQDMNMYAALLNGKEEATFTVPANRRAWVHIARGEVQMNNHSLKGGDGAGVDANEVLHFTNAKQAEIIIFAMVPMK